MPKLWPISWARFSQAVTDPMLVTEKAALSVVEVGPGSGRLVAPELLTVSTPTPLGGSSRESISCSAYQPGRLASGWYAYGRKPIVMTPERVTGPSVQAPPPHRRPAEVHTDTDTVYAFGTWVFWQTVRSQRPSSSLVITYVGTPSSLGPSAEW